MTNGTYDKAIMVFNWALLQDEIARVRFAGEWFCEITRAKGWTRYE